MRPIRLVLLAATLLPALAACQTVGDRPTASRPVVTLEPPRKSDEWIKVASAADVSRIQRLNSAWLAALAEARLGGARADVAAEGDLLSPSAAQTFPAPTPGSYQCRLIRLGRYTTKTRAFERFKPFFCYVQTDGEVLTIVKQTGSQRPAGRLWPDDDEKRMIFLGSVALGNEEQPLAYGENHGRDMAGVFERVAPFRWRLVIPWPRGQSKLDVFELTPVAEQPKAS